MWAGMSGLVVPTLSTTWVRLPMAVSVAVPVPVASSRPGPIVTEIVCCASADDDKLIAISKPNTGTTTLIHIHRMALRVLSAQMRTPECGNAGGNSQPTCSDLGCCPVIQRTAPGDLCALHKAGPTGFMTAVPKR